MNSPQQQDPQLYSSIESASQTADDDDYLQVLDAGEQIFGMFVANDQDLYAQLINNEWTTNSTEDIEDIISRSLVPSEVFEASNELCVDRCSASFSDMHLKGQVAVGISGCNAHDSDNESGKTGRLTPTGDEEDDEMCQ